MSSGFRMRLFTLVRFIMQCEPQTSNTKDDSLINYQLNDGALKRKHDPFYSYSLKNIPNSQFSPCRSTAHTVKQLLCDKENDLIFN